MEGEDSITRKKRLANQRQARWRARQSQESKQRQIEAQRRRRQRETEEETHSRREADALAQRRRRERETQEESKERRQAHAEAQRRRIERETQQESEERRQANAEAQRRRRERETEVQSESIREAGIFVMDAQEYEEKKLMFKVFQHHGSLTTSVYIKKNRKKFTQKQTFDIMVACLPCLDDGVQTLPKMIQKLHTFIGLKADVFLRRDFVRPNFYSSENAFLPTLPLEKYLNLSQTDRLKLFFETLEMNDILIGQVIAHISPCYILSLLCFANGKCRQIDDLDYRVHLPCNKISEEVKVSDFIKVALVGCQTKERRVYVSAEEGDLPEDFNGGNLPKLGRITTNDFPAHYKFLLERGDDPYESFINEDHFLDPHCLDRMMAAFGLNSTDVLSATDAMSVTTYEPEEYASSIRAKQIQDLSKMHNGEGMAFVLKKKLSDAIISFNKSIELDPNNILALFQLGTTYMALKNYEKAVAMLEKVLELQPNYEQARQFLSKAVLFRAKAAMVQDDKWHTFQCCQKAMKFNSNNQELQKKMVEILFEACVEEELGTFAEVERSILSQTADPEENKCASDMEVEEGEETQIEVLPAPPPDEPLPPLPPLPPNIPEAAVDTSFMNRSNVQEAELAFKCSEFVNRIKLPQIEPDKEGKVEKHKSRRSKRRRHSGKKKKRRASRSPGDKDTSLDNISSEEDDSIFAPAREESPTRQRGRSPKQDTESRSPKASRTVSRERRSLSSDRHRNTRRRRRRVSDSSSSSSFGNRRRRYSRSPSAGRRRRNHRRTRHSRSSSSDRFRSKGRRTRSPSLEWRSVSPRSSHERKINSDFRHQRRIACSPTPESGPKLSTFSSHRVRSPSADSASLDRISSTSQEMSNVTAMSSTEHFRQSSYVSTSKRPAISIINDILTKSSES